MNDLYERIEDYLDGTMNEPDRRAFEAEAGADPALAAALAQLREARERLGRGWAGEAADAALRQTLREIGGPYFQSAPAGGTGRNAPVWRLAWALAAGVAVVLVAWFVLRPPAHERLYAGYRAFPPAAFTVKSDILADTGLPAATTAFNQQHYQEALTALQKYRQVNPDNLEAAFFTGLCQLELGQIPQARVVFSELADTPNAWRAEAVWYLALCYLRENDRVKCVETLQGIGPDSAHGADARALRAALE